MPKLSLPLCNNGWCFLLKNHIPLNFVIVTSLSSSLFLHSSLYMCSYVGQEPTLFSGSVSENIARGRAECGEAVLSLQEVMANESSGECFSFLPKKTPKLSASTSKSNFAPDGHIEVEEGLNQLEAGQCVSGKCSDTSYTLICPPSVFRPVILAFLIIFVSISPYFYYCTVSCFFVICLSLICL